MTAPDNISQQNSGLVLLMVRGLAGPLGDSRGSVTQTLLFTLDDLAMLNAG